MLGIMLKSQVYCDIVTYNKGYIFSLFSIPGTELLKPLKFLVMGAIKVSCYVNVEFCKAPKSVKNGS